jgi:hypothetical protein
MPVAGSQLPVASWQNAECGIRNAELEKSKDHCRLAANETEGRMFETETIAIREGCFFRHCEEAIL